MPNRLKIAFFGLPIAAYLLAVDDHELLFATLSPTELPLGRRRLAKLIGKERLFDASALGAALPRRVERELYAETPDLLVSWFWPRRLPEAWLRRPRLGAIGVHPSLLPRHRGPNPFFWMIDQADARVGVTVHRLSAEYDAGAMLSKWEIDPGERDAWQLARALDRPSLLALRQTVARFASGETLPGDEQDPRQASWAGEPSGDLLRADWTWCTARVLRRIRALSPVPGLAIEVRGVALFVTAAERCDVYPGALLPGEAATQGSPPDQLIIRTGDGAISIRRAVAGLGTELVAGQELTSREVAALVAGARVID